MNHFELDFAGREPLQRISHCLDRTVDVTLDDDAQLFNLAGRHPRAQILQRNAAGLLEDALSHLGMAELGNLASLRLLGYRDESSPRFRYARQSEDLNRSRWPSLGNTLPLMVQH